MSLPKVVNQFSGVWAVLPQPGKAVQKLEDHDHYVQGLLCTFRWWWYVRVYVHWCACVRVCVCGFTLTTILIVFQAKVVFLFELRVCIHLRFLWAVLADLLPPGANVVPQVASCVGDELA